MWGPSMRGVRPFLAAAKVLLPATATALVACRPTTVVFPGADPKGGAPVLECDGRSPGVLLSHFDDKALSEILELPAGRVGGQTLYNFKQVDLIACSDRYVIPAGSHLLLLWHQTLRPFATGAQRGVRIMYPMTPLRLDATPGHRYVICPNFTHDRSSWPLPTSFSPRIVDAGKWEGAPPSGPYTPSLDDTCARTDQRSSP